MSYTFLDDYLDDAAPVLQVNETADGTYRAYGKRALDIAFVIAVTPIILPVALLAWVLMFVTGGSGFYRQVRIGRAGKPFTCWKIRTMYKKADQDLQRRMAADPALAAEWQHTQKLDQDPRITRLGNFMRRTSIDELPQFWNVLKGDMSLIGPRPFTPDQKELYDVEQNSRAYYRLRPGISGLWQVRSRNQGSFQDRICFDASYENDVSLRNDAMIAFLTIWEIMRASGK